MTPICVWASRHAPMPAHRAVLDGFDIRQLVARHSNYHEAWLDILITAGSQPPALVMLIAAQYLYPTLVWHINLVSPETIIFHPVMTPPKSGDDWTWTGNWERIIAAKPHADIILQRTAWTPEAVQR